MAGNYGGGLLEWVERAFKQAPEWAQYEDLLLGTLDRPTDQAGITPLIAFESESHATHGGRAAQLHSEQVGPVIHDSEACETATDPEDDAEAAGIGDGPLDQRVSTFDRAKVLDPYADSAWNGGGRKKANPHPSNEATSEIRVPNRAENGAASGPLPSSPARKRGRPANDLRRAAIRIELSKYADAWRDHLGEIFKQLDRQEEDLGDFAGKKINLGHGQHQAVSKWEDLDYADGEERKQIIDALRKYLD